MQTLIHIGYHKTASTYLQDIMCLKDYESQTAEQYIAHRCKQSMLDKVCYSALVALGDPVRSTVVLRAAPDNAALNKLIPYDLEKLGYPMEG